MGESRLNLDRTRAARGLIHPLFLDTPMYPCPALSRELGCEVILKLETANPLRSFKGRGAEVITTMLQDHGATSLVCASAGNLGQALCWSGAQRGLQINVVARRAAPAAKLQRMQALGARLELIDGDYEVARARAVQIAQERGIRLVEDSLDIETCDGAGTIGLELVDHDLDFDAVLLALGGGALATGVGHVLKELSPEAEVICVQPLGAPAMTNSWHARRVLTTATTDTIADGVEGRYPIEEVLTDLLRVADDAVLVKESSIIAAMRLLLDQSGLVVEPSAALGVAAILENPERFAGRRVVTVICGSNVDPYDFSRWTGRCE